MDRRNSTTDLLSITTDMQRSGRGGTVMARKTEFPEWTHQYLGPGRIIKVNNGNFYLVSKDIKASARTQISCSGG